MVDVEEASSIDVSVADSEAEVDSSGSDSDDPEDSAADSVVLVPVAVLPAEAVGPDVGIGLPVLMLLEGTLSTRRAVSPYGEPSYSRGPIAAF